MHSTSCEPASVSEEVKKLPEQLLPSSKSKDPAPLPCEDQTAAAKPPWPLAAEDAQVKTLRLSSIKAQSH